VLGSLALVVEEVDRRRRGADSVVGAGTGVGVGVGVRLRKFHSAVSLHMWKDAAIKHSRIIKPDITAGVNAMCAHKPQYTCLTLPPT
jgi:hypothetical protein